MGTSKATGSSILSIILVFIASWPPTASAEGHHPSYHQPLQSKPSKSPPTHSLPYRNPPSVVTPPYTGGHTPPSTSAIVPMIFDMPSTGRCSLDILKLGLCLDVLGGLVHLGLGNPLENYCCPVVQGLIDLEASVCLCTVIKLRVLNLNIYIPLALQLLITCGQEPPPGSLCIL